MDIVIIAQYLGDLERPETTNNRFAYLGRLLKQKDDVEIITSTFLHGSKRRAANIPGYFEGCKITAIDEPGYPKNVCLKRFASHRALAGNIAKYLRSRKKPDIVYAAVPSLSTANVAARYCQENGIGFIVDIQDIWPEAFKMVFNVPAISDMIFAPMRRQADRIYAAADAIIAVSQTYAQRGLRANGKCKSAEVVYLGTDRRYFDQWAIREASGNGELRIAYAGSLSGSYDIGSVIEAIKRIGNETAIRLVVMGDGALKPSFERHALAAGINCTFTGKLPYPHMVEQLCACHIAVNPIRKGSAGSIINKVGDYAMAGLPVVNTQESQEYRDLLNAYHAGINCACEDAGDIAKALRRLIDDGGLRARMAANSRKLGEDMFDRGSAYQRIIHTINKVADHGRKDLPPNR